MPFEHFPIACGAPLRQSKHLSPETIFQRLQKAQLLDSYDVPGVGSCIALVQGPDRYDAGSEDIRARLIGEVRIPRDSGHDSMLMADSIPF
ncbi:MAG: hypothetical protein WAW73_07660 [Rhodoferax sp.]